jgi:hypothetical protein
MKLGQPDARGCQNYTSPSNNNNWAQYFGLYPNNTLCYFGNQGRFFYMNHVENCGEYPLSYITPPKNCSCNSPRDIALCMLY